MFLDLFSCYVVVHLLMFFPFPFLVLFYIVASPNAIPAYGATKYSIASINYALIDVIA